LEDIITELRQQWAIQANGILDLLFTVINVTSFISSSHAITPIPYTNFLSHLRIAPKSVWPAES
jgi:hypothetical protein